MRILYESSHDDDEEEDDDVRESHEIVGNVNSCRFEAMGHLKARSTP